MSLTDFARLVPTTRGAVSKWENFKTFPRVGQLLRIREITQGAVTPDSFLPPVSSPTQPQEDT